MTLFDVQRFGSTPWDPEAEGLPSLPLSLPLVNEQLAFEGLKLIRVEPASPEDERLAYVLTRLDGREIDPIRVYTRSSFAEPHPLVQVVRSLFPHGI